MRRYKVIGILTAAVLLAGLIAVNLFLSKDMQYQYKNKVISTSVNEKPVAKITFDAFQAQEQITFDATYQRQVGAAVDKQYTGVSVYDLLANAGITLAEGDRVVITSKDNYTVTLHYEEVMRENHAFLVTSENGAYLTQDKGTYMLVLREDALSTRWAKFVVMIDVQRKED